jgi:hypothetical protein
MMRGRLGSFQDSVLYIGSGLIPNDSRAPEITREWKNLYYKLREQSGHVFGS